MSSFKRQKRFWTGRDDSKVFSLSSVDDLMTSTATLVLHLCAALSLSL